MFESNINGEGNCGEGDWGPLEVDELAIEGSDTMWDSRLKQEYLCKNETVIVEEFDKIVLNYYYEYYTLYCWV